MIPTVPVYKVCSDCNGRRYTEEPATRADKATGRPATPARRHECHCRNGYIQVFP